MHSTLLKEHYVEKYWFKEESKKIFHSNWMCVGRIEDFENPGDFKLIDIAGQSILLIKNNDNVIRGFFNFIKSRAKIASGPLANIILEKILIKENKLKAFTGNLKITLSKNSESFCYPV